jgi:hypothetical protein
LNVPASNDIDQALARVIVEEPGYWELYGPLLGALHPDIFEEANRMARAKGKTGDLDLRPWVAKVGLGKILEGIEVGEIIATLDPKKVARELNMNQYLANLTGQQRQRLKELLTPVPKKDARELDVEQYLANLTAQERQRLKELLK